MAAPVRLLQLVALALLGLLGLFYLLPSSSTPPLLASSFSAPSSSPSSVITAADLLRLYESQRAERLADFDVKADEEEFRFRGLSTSLPEYVDRLRTFVYEAFPAHLQPPLLASIARLEQQLPPDPHRPPLSKKIYTTNKDKDDIPAIFAEWGKLHPDWEVDVLDDEGMDAWVDAYFGQSSEATNLGPVWRALPKIVLKSDALRYLIMLLEGGVYSDSDTMPVRRADEWGHTYDAQRMSDPSLNLLTQLQSTLADSARGTAPFDAAESKLHPILDSGISGIIGVEIDITRSVEPDFVRQWFARLVQFTQWTLMFKPFHPIYIDLLEVIYRKALKTEADLASGRITHEQIEDTLNFTGPGPYTDAILRYFLVHLGVKPRELMDVSGSFRIGDIVMVSQYSFSQPVDPKDRNDFGCVHHDFAGRWRQDG